MGINHVALLASQWEGGITPGTMVAGLPAIVRSLLTLQWAGVSRVVIVAGEFQTAIEKLVAKRVFTLKVEYAQSSGDLPVVSGDALYRREILATDLQRGELSSGALFVRYDSRAAVKKARDLLWRELRKPIENDGVVAYFLGRPVSRLFSRFLINTPLTPNHVTMLSFIAALIGALFVAWPATVLLGAGLYWLSFVFDCVDGEIARLKFMGSILGQWLDTIADDMATTFFSLGLSWALFTLTGSAFYLILGGVSAGLYFLCSLLVYRVLHRIGVIDTAQYPYFFMGEGGAASKEKGLFTYFAYLFRRDVILFLHLIFAIFGLYHAMFWLQVGLNLGMNAITLLDQGYRLITGRWPRGPVST
ncbi:CDP-alcohol phosphatidyltransferase family protein [Myxococcota bacterium]|nr:CDP-alcohol phosphatidyltransferase family protein [Myxococcota bacterium]MBU1536614.1 CDP-alcohol phosphatidyltransferase family protein [Myxococcota bacterium]